MYVSGCNYDLDVAMAHPFSQDTLKQAALEEDFAAARREERKMIKYKKQQLAGNTASLNFTSLVFEHFGTWGSEATNYQTNWPEDQETLKVIQMKLTLQVFGGKYSQ